MITIFHHEGHEAHEVFTLLFLRELRVLRGLKLCQYNVDGVLEISVEHRFSHKTVKRGRIIQ